jgi:hypothetical protein
MLHYSSGTPSKKAPGAVKFQQPPHSLQATPSAPAGQSVFSTEATPTRVHASDSRVANILRMYTGTDTQMSIQSEYQMSLEVNDRIAAAYREGDGIDPEHHSTQLSLAILAVEFSVTVHAGDLVVPHMGTRTPEVGTAPF